MVFAKIALAGAKEICISKTNNMKYNSEALLHQLGSDVRHLLLEAGRLQQVPIDLLCTRPEAGRWSAAQVAEHLNIYARHYISAIEQRLHLHRSTPSEEFKAGWLGNYFTQLMKPIGTTPTAKRLRSPRNAQPSAHPDAGAVLTEFVAHQHRLLNLLAVARSANLSTLRIPTSLHPKLTLRLGDTLRFFIAHEQRHFVQIERTLAVARAFLYQEA